GAARRLGRIMALAVAQAGGTVIIHHGHSLAEASETQQAIMAMGKPAHIVQADLSDPDQVASLVTEASSFGPLFALVNNAAIFETNTWESTDIDAWNRHLDINLTAPFLLSQAFARSLTELPEGRIVNILDWRALHPGADHLAYTVSKAALAALTRSLAIALAPKILVNGLAFGAILPPSPNADLKRIIEPVPAGRWAQPEEVGQALIFLLDGPGYITGEILHLDGGRHLI
ncbi:MAG TPA: SDR family oxidoreductase, partial [Anaerolineales bacterium]|nr:SDR family oxidoreductase [Anaerolineales bacterium]